MSAPSNPDTRELPPGWMQQYNREYNQWFYVNMRENPPRSSWEHPLGPSSYYAPPSGPPPPDRSYNRPYEAPAQQGYGAPPPVPDRSYNRSPYGPPQQYGGYPGNQPPYAGPPPQGYYSVPQGGYTSGPGAQNNGPPYYPQAEDQRKQRKGLGNVGTGILAGGAGLIGGALLMEAVESHDRKEREEGYEQGFQDGYDDGQDNNFGDW